MRSSVTIGAGGTDRLREEVVLFIPKKSINTNAKTMLIDLLIGLFGVWRSNMRVLPCLANEVVVGKQWAAIPFVGETNSNGSSKINSSLKIENCGVSKIS